VYWTGNIPVSLNIADYSRAHNLDNQNRGIDDSSVVIRPFNKNCDAANNDKSVLAAQRSAAFQIQDDYMRFCLKRF